MKKQTTSINMKKILSLICHSLEDDKAINIKTIDLKKRSSIADFMIIASGNSTRQVSSMANNLIKKLKDNGISTRKPEGITNSDWVLIDAYDIIIHLFRPEVRDFYALEKMWEIPSSINSEIKTK
ncbi:MAG: ribosome silencing factor [SAR116 cluster bacterium]|mgnify:CR=1 FL=1|nr:ribosome silencing factor [SAR116 cluster bacterium]RPH11261.1 MAG: ribosome silencing factor [Alphaproteobacteria bacterium TMED54]